MTTRDRTRGASRTTGTSSMRDRVRQKAQERETKGGGGTKFNFPVGKDVKFFVVKKGTMNIDILPYKVSVDNHPEVGKGELWYQRTIWVHYNVGPEEKMLLCPKTIKHRCPICEEYVRLNKDPNADETLVKSLKPKEREIFNVLDLNNEAAGIQLWEISYYLFGAKLDEEIKEGKEEWGGFADLISGQTLRIRFTEKSMGSNTFLEAGRVDFESREDYPESTLDKVLDLDSILNILPYEKLEAEFLGIAPEAEKETTPTKVESEGRTSPPAHGHGHEEGTHRRQSSPPLKGEEPEDVPPPRSRTRGVAGAEEVKCPHGGTFGTDCDELDACETCKIWEQCADRKDEMKAAKGGKR